MFGKLEKTYRRTLIYLSRINILLCKIDTDEEIPLKVANVNNRNKSEDGPGESENIIFQFCVCSSILKETVIDKNDSITMDGRSYSVISCVPDFIGSKVVSYRVSVR